MKKRYFFYWFLGFFISFLIILFTIFITFNNIDIFGTKIKFLLNNVFSLVSFFLFLILIVIFSKIFKYKKVNVNNTLWSYFEHLSFHMNIGIIYFNQENGKIIWNSYYLDNLFKKIIIGKKIYDVIPNLKKHLYKNQVKFEIKINSEIYYVYFDIKKNIIILKNMTSQFLIKEKYFDEQIVFGELEIDNFQLLRNSYSQEIIFNIQEKLKKIFNYLSDNYNFYYRQYTEGKYLLITDQKSLNIFIDDNFSFIDEFRNYKVIEEINLSLSIGFAAGYLEKSKLIDYALQGLTFAQTRGGDQVSVIFEGKNPIFFGSKNEIYENYSRVSINKLAVSFINFLQKNKPKNLIIYGHKNADLDAVGSALGIAYIAKKYVNDIYIQNKIYDTTTENELKKNANSINKLFPNQKKELFVSSKFAKKNTFKNTLVVFTDVSSLKRIENPMAVNKINPNNIFIFDHHRYTKLEFDINPNNVYVDTVASSASEIITEMMMFLNYKKYLIKLPKIIAQMLLNGIYLDTMNFRKAVSFRTFSSASFLQMHKASSLEASEPLKIKEENVYLIQKIVSRAREIKPGFFLSTYIIENISNDVISLAAEEILKVKGRKASFVIAKNMNNLKLSARSIDVNVQIIAESLGGGGHFYAAAASSNEEFQTFKDNVVQAIISKGSN